MNVAAAEGEVLTETALNPPSPWAGGTILCALWWIGAIIVKAPDRAGFASGFTTEYAPDFMVMLIGLPHSIGLLIQILALPLGLACVYHLVRKSSPTRNTGRVFFWVTLVLFVWVVGSALPLGEWLAPAPPPA